MDCNNCVCALVCRHAQDTEYREQIRSGESTCCDYYPRPDGSLKKAIQAVSTMNTRSGIQQSIYVIEECSELIKELMKKQRGKGSEKDIIAEACDVLATLLVFFSQHDIPDYIIEAQLLYKYNRALERYNKTGEV